MFEGTGCKQTHRCIQLKWSKLPQQLHHIQLLNCSSGKFSLRPLKEWHSSIPSARNKYFWEPQKLSCLVSYGSAFCGWLVELFLRSGHPVWILWGLIIQFTFLFCLFFSETLMSISVFCISGRLLETCPDFLSVRILSLSQKYLKMASLFQTYCGNIDKQSGKTHLLGKPGFNNITSLQKQ